MLFKPLYLCKWKINDPKFHSNRCTLDVCLFFTTWDLKMALMVGMTLNFVLITSNTEIYTQTAQNINKIQVILSLFECWSFWMMMISAFHFSTRIHFSNYAHRDFLPLQFHFDRILWVGHPFFSFSFSFHVIPILVHFCCCCCSYPPIKFRKLDKPLQTPSHQVNCDRNRREQSRAILT